MGTWGPKLYDDDVTEDVKDSYIDLLKRGEKNDEITKLLIKDYHDYITDIDDGPLFWFALADTQWDYGRLIPHVKEKALYYLKLGTNLERWKLESPLDYNERISVLQDLEKKLNSVMPSKKRIRKYKFYKCNWEIGDTYAYKLESEEAKNEGLDNRYFIIRKVANMDVWPGNVNPIVYVQITNDNYIPTMSDELIKLEYVFTARNEHRYLLIIDTEKSIPYDKLQYIGNFQDVPLPNNENSIFTYPPSNYWKHVERYLIKMYKALNCSNKNLNK